MLEDTYHRTIQEFSRNPETMQDAWRKVQKDVGGFDFDSSNPKLQDIAKLSATGTFLQQLAIAASSQGVAGT